MMEYRYTFRLKPGRDDDLIRWLEPLGEGERSFHIRQTLRRGLAGSAVSASNRVRIADPKKDLPVAQETVEVALDMEVDDIEARLERLAESF